MRSGSADLRFCDRLSQSAPADEAHSRDVDSTDRRGEPK